MGLPLFVARVESDVETKPAAEKAAAQARSTIRRTDRRARHVTRGPTRDLANTSILRHRPSASPRLRSPSDEPRGAAGIPEPIRDRSRRQHEGLRDLVHRMGNLDERVVHLFGERWAELHAQAGPSPPREDSQETVPIPPPPPRSRSRSRPSPPMDQSRYHEPYFISSIRSTQQPRPARLHQRPSLRSSRSRSGGILASEVPGGPFYARRSVGGRPSLRRPAARRDGPVFRGDRETAQVDGLGDRARSLSPEGDGVWDTLLSTLTPDPQPPSVGSSFASASVSASAAASQSNLAGSSSTSLTGPETAEESAFEQPCESGCENTDTEGDDDEEMEQNPLTRFTGLRNRRSYADVAAHSGSHSEELLDFWGGIGGMQRIVRNLARREDIPDEWWAEAGLSRTLSRETSRESST